MAEEKLKNLCGQVPEELHAEILRHKEEAEMKTLGEYMTWAFRKLYSMEGSSTMAKGKTIAFEVSPELFEKFKEYLARHKKSQKAFLTECIQYAVNEDVDQGLE